MTNECKLEDFARWRSKHDDHDKTGNVAGSQAHGVNCGNVEQPPQVPPQLLASGSEIEGNGLGACVVKAGTHKPALHQQLAQCLKFAFGFFSAHKRVKRPNDPSSATADPNA